MRRDPTPPPAPPAGDADGSEDGEIRSGLPPPPEEQGTPTLFEIASLLDSGRYTEAVEAIERLGASSTPALTLLRARALIGAGRRDEALDVLARLAAAPLLDPEVRAGCARLLVEQGEVERGLEQARRAHADDPEPALVQLVLALGLVRAARRGAPTTLYDEADDLLHALHARTAPHPALVLALRAAAQSEVGDPERALDMARRALSLDARSPDALAALAIAGARLGRLPDALAALGRLREASPLEARVVRRRLRDMGLPDELPALEAALPRSPWDAAERRIASGRRRDAMAEVTAWMALRVEALAARAVVDDPPAFSTAAAALLTEAPFFRAFAPWDLSLHGLNRLEAALTVLLGDAGWTDPSVDATALGTVLSGYVGGTWCVALGASWQVPRHGEAQLLLGGRVVDPKRLLEARLQRGAEASFLAQLPALGHSAWQIRRPCPVRPPAPWGVAEWPELAVVAELGRAFSKSAAALFCATHAESPLDHTLLSLAALDRWLALLSPPDAPPRSDEPWLPRAAVLCGGYVGETLRETLGGVWRESASEPVGPARYELVLGTESVRPVLEAWRRLAGLTANPLADWSSKLLRRLG